MTRPLEEAHHADIGQRHIREYTLKECKYLLTRQDKYLYRFCMDKLIMDRSWDGLFYTEHGYRHGLRQIKPGTILRSLVTRISRRYRSNIIILAHKPKDYQSIGNIAVADGFYPPENFVAPPSYIRAPIVARWMKAAATVSFPAPSGVAAVRHVDLLIWMPAPATAGCLCTWKLKSTVCPANHWKFGPPANPCGARSGPSSRSLWTEEARR